MKFSIEKNKLMDAIFLASKAVSNKTSIAVLEGLLLEANENLTLYGFDLSMGIKASVPADVIEPGKLVLNAKIFGDIIRKLPNDTIYLETDSQLLTTIRCGRSVFNIIGTSADDFPAMPEVDEDKALVLPQNTLKSLISQTIFAVSDNESKPIHTGCLFTAEDTRLEVAAVDGYRLSVRRETIASIDGNMKFVVPGSALREVERILDDSDEPVEIYPDAKHILFRLGQTVLISRLLEGEFLNYNSAIPKDFAYQLKIRVKDFIDSLERVSLIVSERLKNPVRMTFDGNTLQMSCITAIGKSYDECGYEGQVENLEIGFNNRYLLDALRAIDDEEVMICMKSSLNPMVFQPLEGDKFTYLVLPVRLKANE
jgi:DNA polymerase-3 subunit beta